MNWPEYDRWLRLWQAARALGDPAIWYELLTQAYAQPQRHYHNQEHVAECLAEFDAAKHLAQQPVAVELALWLERFLERERIYTHEHFGRRYEQSGRRNLEESIRKLKRLWG